MTESNQFEEIEARYRLQVAERYNRLSLTGLPERDPGLHEVSLEHVFVKLNTEIAQSGNQDATLQTEQDEIISSELSEFNDFNELPAQDLERERKAAQHLPRLKAVKSITLTVADALHKYRHLVVVGGPGSGKTTLTRWLALRFAQYSQENDDALGPNFAAPRLPILLELRRFADRFVELSRKPGVADLADEIAQFISTHAYYPDTPADFVHTALAEGRCLLLVDGLDEIADSLARQAVTEALVAFVRRPNGNYRDNLCVVTSRPHGFSDVTLPGFQTSLVQPFSPEEVDLFVNHWYATAYKGEAESEASTLIEAIHDNKRVLELATNPLLCTIIAIVYRNNRVLPNRRVALYHKCCEALLDTWERNKKIRESGLIGGYDWQTKLELLAPLAYWMHQETERVAAPEEALAIQLAGVLKEKGLQSVDTEALNEARSFLATIRDRSGLMQGRGDGSLEFAHRTFQEYLTARYIAAQPDPDYIDLVMEHLHETWWKEVHLLVIGHLGSGVEGTKKTSKLIITILTLNSPPFHLFRPVRFNPWKPNWFNILEDRYEEKQIKMLTVYSLAFLVVMPPSLPALLRNKIAFHLKCQTSRRLSWILARELSLSVAGLLDCSVLGVDTATRNIIRQYLEDYLLELSADPGRINPNDLAEYQWVLQSLSSLDMISPRLINTLIGQMKTFDHDVRSVVTAILIELGRTSALAKELLLDASKSNDSQIRSGAVFCLAQFNQASRQIIDAVLDATTDSDNRVRLNATFGLGQIGQMTSEIFSALVHALHDSNVYVRREAASSLGKLGQASQVVIAALLDALADSDGPTQQAATLSLGLIRQGSPMIVGALLEKMADADGRVRYSAISSLIQIAESSPLVLSTLLDEKKNPNSHIRQGIASVLGELSESVSEIASALLELLRDPDWHVRQEGATSLGRLELVSPAIIAALIEALNDTEPFVRTRAMSSLELLSQTSASELTINALIAALSDSNGHVWKRAVATLSRLSRNSPQITPALISTMEAADERKRLGAAASLARIGWSSPRIEELFVIALNDRDRQLRRELVSSLDYIHTNATQAWSDTSDLLRHELVSSLGQTDIFSPKLSKALVMALKDPDETIRQRAVTSLWQIGHTSDEIIKALVACTSDRNASVRQRAIHALIKSGYNPPDLIGILIRTAEDHDPLVRKAALSGIGQLGTVSSKMVAVLISATGDIDPYVQQIAASALGQIRIENKTLLKRTLTKLVQRLHVINDDHQRLIVLRSIQNLVQGHPIPSYRWVPLRTRQQQTKRRRRIGYWVIAVAMLLLASWAAAVSTSYIDLDQFWVRFAGAAAALLGVVAGIFQIISWLYRPPWDKE